MKVKMVGLMVLALHVVVLGGFLLMQGCTTGTSPVPWLNWPYGAPPRERVVFDDDDDFAAPLPPAIEEELAPLPAFDVAPYEHPVQPDDQIHVVQKGETLSGIAARYGTRWRELADYNQLSDPDRLQAGYELRIPGYLGPPSTPSPAPSPARTPAPAPAAIEQGESYEIRPGDTLGAIAQRSGLTVDELKAANNLTSDRIFAGQTLIIPREGRTPQPAPAPRTQPAPEPAPIAEPAPRAEPAPVPQVAPDAPQPAAIPSAAPVYEHVLYPGESIDDVARQYGSTRSAILELNNIDDPSTLRPGTKLLVPMPD